MVSSVAKSEDTSFLDTQTTNMELDESPSLVFDTQFSDQAELSDGSYILEEDGSLVRSPSVLFEVSQNVTPAPETQNITSGTSKTIMKPIKTTSRCSAKSNVQENLTKVVQSFSDLVKQKNTTAVPQQSYDADMDFLKSIADDMKHIPLKNKLKFKIEVMQLLQKYTDEENNLEKRAPFETRS